jgi:hypothetical protein
MQNLPSLNLNGKERTKQRSNWEITQAWELHCLYLLQFHCSRIHTAHLYKGMPNWFQNGTASDSYPFNSVLKRQLWSWKWAPLFHTRGHSVVPGMQNFYLVETILTIILFVVKWFCGVCVNTEPKYGNWFDFSFEKWWRMSFTRITWKVTHFWYDGLEVWFKSIVRVIVRCTIPIYSKYVKICF